MPRVRASRECRRRSGEVDESKEERHDAHAAETDDAINNVTVRELHAHVLPRLPHVIRGQPEDAAQERDGDRFHGHPRDQQDGHADGEAQHGEEHAANADGLQRQRQRGQRRVQQQPRLIVHVSGQSGARPSAQSLSRVAPRGAPGVQGERHQTQADMRYDDGQRRVAVRHVEGVDGVQKRAEEG